MVASTDKELRRQIRIKIGDLLDQNCKGCQIKQKNEQEHDVATALEYCTNKCNVGIQIKRLGDKLETGRIPKLIEEEEERVNSKQILTKENYLNRIKEGSGFHDILREFKIRPQELSALKKEWGLKTEKESPNKKKTQKKKQKNSGIDGQVNPDLRLLKIDLANEKEAREKAEQFSSELLKNIKDLTSDLQKKDKIIQSLKTLVDIAL
jgi:predicted HNH restriction endonuclease